MSKIAELVEMAKSPCSTPIEVLRQTAVGAEAELRMVLNLAQNADSENGTYAEAMAEIVRILAPAPPRERVKPDATMTVLDPPEPPALAASEEDAFDRVFSESIQVRTLGTIQVLPPTPPVEAK